MSNDSDLRELAAKYAAKTGAYTADLELWFKTANPSRILALLDRAEALERHLLKACSMLDDAVQLRDDANKWFPEIDKLRKTALPGCTCPSTYAEETRDPKCKVHKR